MKAYSGYVHLPPNAQEDRNYETNTFFWFFEARESPEDAPLSLWLQGGPGVPSITAAIGENGPCIIASDSKTSTLNPWSFNRRVNMLYIDQPSQVGFSYDTLVNGTIDQIESPVAVAVDNFEKELQKRTTPFLSEPSLRRIIRPLLTPLWLLLAPCGTLCKFGCKSMSVRFRNFEEAADPI